MINVKFFNAEEFNNLKTVWNFLEIGSDMTAFQSFSWYSSLNELYKKAHNPFKKCFYAVAFDEELPVMIAPLFMQKAGILFYGIGIKKGVHIIGDEGYTDYLNFIYKDFSAEAFNCILDAVSKKFKTYTFIFKFLYEKTMLAKYIKDTYNPECSKNKCAELVLPETFEEYHMSLSKSMRQNIRTAINRQKRDNISFSYQMLTKLLDKDTREKIMSIRKVRVAEKNRRINKRLSVKGKVAKLFNKAYKVFTLKHNIIDEDLNTWCFLVKNNETQEIASFYWGIKDITDSKYYVIYAGVNEKYEWYSPNISCFFNYFKEIYENGKNNSIEVFDFTRGGEKYKFDIGCSLKECVSFNFLRKTGLF